MTLTLKQRDIYGKTTFYPSCDKSNVFASMLRQKTLTTKDLSNIELLGFTIHITH